MKNELFQQELQNKLDKMIIINDCMIIELNKRCQFWITGAEKSWSQPCECIEDDGYCYCEYDGHGDKIDKLFSSCPLVVLPKNICWKK